MITDWDVNAPFRLSEVDDKVFIVNKHNQVLMHISERFIAPKAVGNVVVKALNAAAEDAQK